MAVDIRRIRVDEGPRLREVRLRALLDTPSAFARTHAEEAAYDNELWELRAAAHAASTEFATFFAVSGDRTVGMVGAFVGDEAAFPDLVSMWVAPEARGSDVASRLVEAVLAWASDSGHDQIELWVTRGNDRAHAFYERMGFVETGDVAPLPSDPCKEEIRMRRSLR